MLYKLNDATVSFDGNTILSHISFEIHGNEKIALTGRNGAGKTTLLRLIAGLLETDRDDKRQGAAVETARSVTIGMLDQFHFANGAEKVDSILGKCQGCEEWEADKLLTGFGFLKTDRSRRLDSFSGGEQTKLEFIGLLLQKPDILLLDEPTNHLDLKALQWLEGYLKSYEKAVVFVSHDRFFMDKVADVVYDLENGRLTRYAMNYTAYRETKRRNAAIAFKAWEKNEQEIERLNGLIERFKNKPRKAAFARSKRTIVERMQHMEKPASQPAKIYCGEIIPENAGAKWVLEAEHLKIGYLKPVLELSMKLQRGSKIAIMGDNGTGKSTFLKTVAGLIRKIDGKLTLGNNIDIGYFDQMLEPAFLKNAEQTVYGCFREQFPLMEEKKLRSALADFLFSGRDAYKSVGELSGGERARLCLAVIISHRPNFLVLDEPTNHMDIDARETLESIFRAYKGTILFVSHDRYFVSRLAESFYIFDRGENEGRALYYPFSYGHYLERMERAEKATQLRGIMTSEEEALLAGLKAVPRRESHEIRFRTTEEARADWELGIRERELASARQELEETASFEEYEENVKRLTEIEIAWFLANEEVSADGEHPGPAENNTEEKL